MHPFEPQRRKVTKIYKKNLCESLSLRVFEAEENILRNSLVFYYFNSVFSVFTFPVLRLSRFVAFISQIRSAVFFERTLRCFVTFIPFVGSTVFF